MLSAKDIYQAHLDCVSKALWERSYEAILDLIRFPSFVETDTEVLKIDSRECYLPSLISLRETLDRFGVTAYHRLCREAVFTSDDPNRIEGIHETFPLTGTTPVIEPYLNHMTLVQQDGLWQSAGLRSATQNTNWLMIKHPEPSNGPTAQEAETQEQDA